MSNIEQLPICSLQTGVQSDEDLMLGLLFANADGTALDLSGIDFTARLWAGKRQIAAFAGTVSGDAANYLLFAVYAADIASLLRDKYGLTILATDGTQTRDILGDSTLQIGAAQVTTIEPLQSGPNVATMTAVSVGAIGPFPPPTSPKVLSTSQTLTDPGNYVVTVAGLTITLPAAAGTIAASITITDVSGSGATVAGTVSNWGGQTSMSLPPDGSMSFFWWVSESMWVAI